MLIGYARVSTYDQNLDLQKDALNQAGCEKIFTDQVSGSKSARPGLDQMMHTLRAGDTVVVWRLDRLGRSLKHLIELVNHFEQNNIGLIGLHDSIDTTTPGGYPQVALRVCVHPGQCCITYQPIFFCIGGPVLPVEFLDNTNIF